MCYYYVPIWHNICQRHCLFISLCLGFNEINWTRTSNPTKIIIADIQILAFQRKQNGPWNFHAGSKTSEK